MTLTGLRVVAVAVSTVALALLFGSTAANATRTVKFASHVSITHRGLLFSGRVTSSKTACVGGRRVTLFRTNGDVLGSATTASSGRWQVAARGSAGITLGRFYAKVKQRSEGTAGTVYVCKAARSPTIPYR